ncbi:uncharacterized protein LOC129798089 [Phlebotomus papatasi]|uniref:uncharacterized protein LOC129798089 n=1 Tax=Phlebotomus papatasi TaxID=29031 RepID=UPI002483841D|nr:uncharacterized protein LOC129798089 [Phlebotomus papatasi]
MTVSKIQMAQPAIVSRIQTQSQRPSTRRCLFEQAPPGENLRIAKIETERINQEKYEEVKERYGYDILRDQPVEASSEEVSERLQETEAEGNVETGAGGIPNPGCSTEVKDTVKKVEVMCNGASARNPGKEISSAEKSHRVKPYDRTKQTHITDYMREVKKPSRSSKESKEKH